MDKEYLEQAIAENKTLRGIGRETNTSLGTVRYWIKKHQLQIASGSHHNWDEEALRKAAEGASSKREVLQRLGLRDSGSIYSTLNKMAEQWDISLPITDPSKQRVRSAYSLEKVFQEDTHFSGVTLRRCLLTAGVAYECKECQLTDWNGRPIQLHVDHIDGNHRNNLFNNLRFLCPNCHSQTTTYSRKKTQTS